MSKRRPANTAVSVHQRLLNQAREQNEDFNLLLLRYALQRLLYRLSQSLYHDDFVLKGAMLVQLWTGQTQRPTRDLDLLSLGTPSTSKFEQVFREICVQSVEDDGLQYLTESVRAEPIKEEDEYQGLRLRLQAKLGAARISLQVDIGFGDAVTPGPDQIIYPALLGFPPCTLKAYPRETVVAEKFQAMVMLGIANSRMKDFYDLRILAQQFEFSGWELAAAIRATFDRRRTALPEGVPLALAPDFAMDRDKRVQWRAFVRRSGVDDDGRTLTEIAGELQRFLMPPTEALVRGTNFNLRWPPRGPWKVADD